ncbi:hypothetical protein BJ138DRAFT_1107396 [Hygrophoropsis aurantiaca]|uniref:Uncharacterized protein n=1 Tax=Hygrophoropsis aurantiaca TaxID=72124 RepID=A0ACB7ZRT0_9AGAM|nr:hypothetical protein BJ138DRAFT_1107396 [Hygrophoropsis aurantiaca]
MPHRTRFHSSVTFAAPVLSQSLKAHFPTARGSSGYRLFPFLCYICRSRSPQAPQSALPLLLVDRRAGLFVSAFMLAFKYWSIVAQGMFQLREINQMERGMRQYLEWELNVEPATLKEFEDMALVRSYVHSAIDDEDDNALNHHFPFPPAATSETPTPSYGQRYPSPPKPAYLPPPISRSAYMTPPTTPDTPSSSYSAPTSPASSASPPMPPGIEDLLAKIVSASSSPAVLTSKSKMFAFASPSICRASGILTYTLQAKIKTLKYVKQCKNIFNSIPHLKARFPTARGSSGHTLFVSVFMLASKVICDDTYSNKSRSVVAQGMFQLWEIKRMETAIPFSPATTTAL